MLKGLCQRGGKGGADLLGRDKVLVGGEWMPEMKSPRIQVSEAAFLQCQAAGLWWFVTNPPKN